MLAAMFLDLALAYDVSKRGCDLVYQGGRLVVDVTAATPLLIAIGTDARAEPDDVLPDGVTAGSIQAGFNRRRGWAGDRLATDGSRLGSRLWLESRAKLGDPAGVAGKAQYGAPGAPAGPGNTAGAGPLTLLNSEDYARQATDGFPDRYGVEVTVAASRVARDAMLLRVQAGEQVLNVRRNA